MTFPSWPIPTNWLEIIVQYHAYAYTGGDVYDFTGDISANTELQWDAVTWNDGRTKPTYATLSDTAFKQEALNAMGGYLSSVNYYLNSAQVAANTADIAALDTTKVDKVTGKGLSQNDFDDAHKTKLDGL